MPQERCDIVIAGASFAGIALALALHKASGGALALVVLDGEAKTGKAQPADTVPDQRAFSVAAGSVQLLSAIGVWTLIESRAQPVAAINISAPRLQSPLRQTLLNYDNHTQDGDPASFIVPAPVLREALWSAAATTGLRIEPRAAIARLTPAPEQIAVATVPGATFAASLCVAADGRKSPSRDLMGIKVVGWEYPQCAIVTGVAHTQNHRGIATQHFLEAGPFAILPLPGGHRSSLVWSEEKSEAARIMALDDAAFQAELEQRFGGILGAITLDGPRVWHPLDLHLARGLTAARFAVMGDAARGVHPLAGQGLNLGLRDVGALAECVIDAARLGLDVGSAQVLARYERWRRFDSVMSAGAMDGLNRLFSNDNAILRTVRQTGLTLTDRLPGLKQMLVGEAAGLSGALPKLLAGELP